MAEVLITGWRKGCDTVAAIKELREKVPMPLNEAHALINRVLGNEKVRVVVPTPAGATSLTESLGKIGLIAVKSCD
jgi:hypothetical protein